MRIPGFGDRATGLFGAAGVLGRARGPTKRHRARGRGEAARIAQFGGNRQRGEIIDPAETPEPFDARPQGLERVRSPRSSSSGAQPRDRFIDGAQVGGVGLVERLATATAAHAARRSCAFDHAFFVPVNRTTVPAAGIRQAMPRAQEIGPDVFATPEEIARGFFLVGGDMNRRQGAARDTGIASCAASRRSVFTRSPARRGINAGAITSHGTSCAVRARWSSKPHGPAS